MILRKIFSDPENLIYGALVSSCVLHALILAGFLLISPRVVVPLVKPMEVRYQPKPEKVPGRKSSGGRVVPEIRQASRESPVPRGGAISKPMASAGFFKDPGGQQYSASSQRIDVPEKQPVKMADLVGKKRDVSIPVFTTQKITNPQYVGYNDRIRERIRNRAYFYIDDPRFEAGEVYLTFVVSADGTLRDLKIINERSHANEYLRSVGLRSVKESSPFPPFPSDLSYPELSFNVVISFEVSGD